MFTATVCGTWLIYWDTSALHTSMQPQTVHLELFSASLRGLRNWKGIISLQKEKVVGKCLCSGQFHQMVLLNKHPYHSDVK